LKHKIELNNINQCQKNIKFELPLEKSIKILKPIYLLILFLFFAQNCKDPKAEVVYIQNNDVHSIIDESMMNNKLATATFEIKGMTCEMGCAKTIEKKLSNLEGTSLAKVDFKNETASVLFDLNKIDKDILKSTVESIGDKKTYKVENIKISL
jgi:copper chaperone CopZ